MHKCLVIKSTQYNPWSNLALEAYLVEQLSAGHYQAILYLWQNDNTVVIGRNQNAWAECKTGLLEEEGGFLARRSTGGGAVFHDLGNLNYSLILPKEIFRTEDNFAMLLKALQSQGIEAEKSGRNDIVLDGLKFSGNAFRIFRTAGLHHGTLLVHSAFERVGRYLTVSSDKLKAKGVSSVRSRITNLQAVKPDITVADLNLALEEAFLDFFCSGDNWQIHYKKDEHFKKQARYRELEEQYSSWHWRYGETLAFDAEIADRFSWGGVSLGFCVKNGQVDQARVYSDALDSDFISQLPVIWQGCRFHSADLVRAVLSGYTTSGELITPRQQMARDIADLVQQQGW